MCIIINKKICSDPLLGSYLPQVVNDTDSIGVESYKHLKVFLHPRYVALNLAHLLLNLTLKESTPTKAMNIYLSLRDITLVIPNNQLLHYLISWLLTKGYTMHSFDAQQ